MMSFQRRDLSETHRGRKDGCVPGLLGCNRQYFLWTVDDMEIIAGFHTASVVQILAYK